MAYIRTRLLAVLLAALSLGLLGCQTQEEDTAPETDSLLEIQESQTFQGTLATETENLVKLCKVWGYTKYWHPAFLLGKKGWDEELLTLIPQLREMSTAEEVNELLHNWFVSLGEIDYESRAPVVNWSTAAEDEIVVIADTSWTSDATYLGEALAADFALFPEALPNVSRSKAPMQLTKSVLSTYERALAFFANEGLPDPKYDDAGFRLLGLFRLWNAIEYYFPYTDTLEQNWEDTLAEYIPQMLEGEDPESYEQTLASMAFLLHDPHVTVYTASGNTSTGLYYQAKLGTYYLPVPLAVAEGKLVVSDSVEECPLETGDILLSINGTDIEKRIEECKQFNAYPREDAVLNRMRYTITLSQSEDIEVSVLRTGVEMTYSVSGIQSMPVEKNAPQVTHQILEGNLGLINPALCTLSEVDTIMANLRETDGLIIDLRQYPGDDGGGLFGLARYFGVSQTPFAVYAVPSIAVPGAYVKETYTPVSYWASGGASYPYNKPVAVLMDNRGTQSNAETTVQMLRMAENVVTMGDNSAGAGGHIVFLPIPGPVVVQFSSNRFYTIDGKERYRTGITPDIPVKPTIQGIKEGRDEVMEAAIEYIKSKS